jgi:hypothetical protein
MDPSPALLDVSEPRIQSLPFGRITYCPMISSEIELQVRNYPPLHSWGSRFSAGFRMQEADAKG